MNALIWIASGAGAALAVVGVGFAVRKRESPWLGRPLGSFVATLALVALFASLALGALAALLARMHLPGTADLGIEAITGLGVGASPETIAAIMNRWSSWYTAAEAGFVARPGVVLWAYLMIDSLLFIPAYVTVLATVRLRLAILEPGWRGATSTTGQPAWTDLGQALRRVGIPIGLALADAGENVLTEIVVLSPLETAVATGRQPSIDEGLALVLRFATIVKWTLVLLLVINTLPALAVGWQKARLGGKTRMLARGFLRLRAMAFVVAAFALIVLLNLQVPDLIRRWSWREATLAAAAALLFGFVVWVWAGRILGARRDLGRQPNRMRLLAAAFFVGVLGGVGWLGGVPASGLFVPAGVLLVLAWLDSLGPENPPPTEDPGDFGILALPKLLAIAPVIFLGAAALRATLPEAIFNHPNQAWPTVLVLLFSGLLPIALGMGIYRLLGGHAVMQFTVEGSGTAWILRVLGTLAAVYVYWRIVAAVWSFSQAVGALALIGFFFAVLAALIGAVSVWVERVPPPRAVWGFGFRRAPIFGLVVVWGFFGDAVHPHSPYHNVRVDVGVERLVPPVTIADALDHWEARNDQTGPGEGMEQIPMLFIAANGGGIKAAVWTALALECVLQGGDVVQNERARDICHTIAPRGTDRIGQVFSISSVSGGSLGSVEFIAQELRSRPDMDVGTKPASTGAGWIRDVLGNDFVSPTLAWQVFVEAPRALLQFMPDMDRAEVLERSWERGWVQQTTKVDTGAALWKMDALVSSPLAQGFLSTWQEHQQALPLLLLNGTTVEDGCRVIVSALATDGMDAQLESNTAPAFPGRNCSGVTRLKGELPNSQLFAASRDVRHFLCDPESGDVRLSTAALLSARFPWVSPGGRLAFCSEEQAGIRVVDGGYLDNSGGATAAELWEAVEGWVEAENTLRTESCIVPYLLLIDSGYGPTPETKSDNVRELAVPLSTWLSARSSRTVEGRNDAALAFRRPVEGVAIRDRVATLFLRTQPEGEVPLGWAIDDTSIDALEAQLVSNQEELEEIRGWFENEACS